MANKTISIDRSTLLTSAPDGSYRVRYRVLSNDKSQVSEWSEYKKIVPSSSIHTSLGTIIPSYAYSNPTLTVYITLKATQVKIVNSFDFYVSWKISGTWQPWKLVNTLPWNGNSFTLNITKDTGATNGRVAMFASTYPLLTSAQISLATTTGNPGNMNYVFVDTVGIVTTP